MKVAIDISPLNSIHRFRGVGSYTQNLVTALQELVVKEARYRDWQIDLIPTSNFKPQTFDLIHYPYFDLFWLTLPLKKPWPTVVTVHDLTPLVFPKQFPKGIRGWLKYQVQRYSLRGARAIITDSQNSKKDIIKFIGFPQERIFVVYLAPAKEFRRLPAGDRQLKRVKKKYSLLQDFVLYVGDVNWNKNLEGLIRAFKKVKSQKFNHKIAIENLKLVLVGKAFKNRQLPETQRLLRLIKELKLTPQVMTLGFVPKKDLVAIYNLATVYCQPSFYEGFGLPVLEAMACGTPVVAAKTASLPEICGEAAIMINPYDPDDLGRGIKKALFDDFFRLKMINRGLKWVRRFNWEKTAQETLEVYKKVLTANEV